MTRILITSANTTSQQHYYTPATITDNYQIRRPETISFDENFNHICKYNQSTALIHTGNNYRQLPNKETRNYYLNHV